MTNPLQLTDIEIAQKYINKSRNAADKGHEFTLSLTEFMRLMKRKTCYYTGVHLQNEYLTNANGRTLDRIDNKLGYVKGNVVTCSFYFNQLKSAIEDNNTDFTADRVLLGIKKIKKGN